MKTTLFCQFELSLKLAVFIALSIFASLLWGVEVPYEKCNWKNLAYTNRLVTEHLNFQSEADCPDMRCATRNVEVTGDSDQATTFDPLKSALNIPPECFFVSAVRSIEKEPAPLKDEHGRETNYSNYYYCESRNSTQSNNVMIATDSTGDHKIEPHPPCLNKDYINMTHNSFHKVADCFEFSHEDKKQVFALLNHESSFILNQKSDTGARCYGQLTTNTITEINKRIYVSNVSEDIRSKIYNDFASKCPNLLSQIQIPSKIRERADKSWKGNRWRKGKYRGQEYKGAMDAYDDNFNNIKSVGKRMTCQLTQDPNTCFFYAMYNMKKKPTSVGKHNNRL